MKIRSGRVMKAVALFWVAPLLVFQLIACGSLHKTAKKSTEEVHEVLLDDLRFRSEWNTREKTYSLECKKIDELIPDWFGPQHEEILKCLNGIPSGTATYAYELRDGKAKMKWLKSAKEALCLQTVIPEIPLPLELYWLGKNDDRGTVECYSMNLNSEVDVFADIRLPWNRYRLEIPFPLAKPLKTKRELYYWYEILLLLSLRANSDGKLKGSLVPDLMCKSCFASDPLLEHKKNGKMPVVTWR